MPGISMYTLHLHRIISKLLLDRYHAQLVEDDDLFFSVSRVCSQGTDSVTPALIGHFESSLPLLSRARERDLDTVTTPAIVSNYHLQHLAIDLLGKHVSPVALALVSSKSRHLCFGR